MDYSASSINVAIKNYDKVKVDKDGNKYVQIEKYSSGDDSNSCLHRIIRNNYDLESANIKPFDEKYNSIEKQVMEANENIYNGLRKMPDGKLSSSILYEGEEFILPEINEMQVEENNYEPKMNEMPELVPLEAVDLEVENSNIEPPVSEDLKIILSEMSQQIAKEGKTEAAKEENPPVTVEDEKPEKPKTDKPTEAKSAEKSKEEFDYSLDDGVISTEDKLKNFGEGLLSPITGMFDSVENFAIGAGVIAGSAALIVATGGAAAPFLAIAGMAVGGFNIGKNAYNAYNAKTDKEAEEAWKGIGGGVSVTGLSALGAKTSSMKYSKTNGKNVKIEASANDAFTPVKTTEKPTSANDAFTPVKTAEKPTVSKSKDISSEPAKSEKITTNPENTVEKPVLKPKDEVKEPVKTEEAAPVKETVTKKAEKTEAKTVNIGKQIQQEAHEALHPKVSQISKTSEKVLNNGIRIIKVTLKDGREIFRYRDKEGFDCAELKIDGKNVKYYSKENIGFGRVIANEKNEIIDKRYFLIMHK